MIPKPGLACLIVSLLAAQQSVAAFVVPLPRISHHAGNKPSSSSMPMSSSNDASSSSPNTKSLIVISPPGGVGEVTAVKAATMGSSVRWFVVSQSTTANQNVVLSQTALDSIAEAGGKVELAGADADSLLVPSDDPKSAIGAVSKWCGQADGIACTFDGVDQAIKQEGSDRDPTDVWKDAIKVAAKEASSSVGGGPKLAILSAFDEDETEESGGIGALVGSLLGGGGASVPASLAEALSPDVSKVCLLRHGKLFGTPESSPDFSPLVGGPLRNAELCEEYAMRSVRIDPTLSVTGNILMGKNTRSSRHTVGEAAALIAQGKFSRAGLDLCLSSQLGTEPVPSELWEEEFKRSEEMLASGEGAQLFTASFSSVPDTERLADWLATKWAPAVLRTYDIAAIRVGARPVFANRAGEGTVEIVWQELVDFKTLFVGTMIVKVSNTGMVATRGPGDAAAGYGSISSKPLNGENVLLMRLAEAASQAIDKGLAKQTKVAKKVPIAAAPTPAVTSIKSSGTVTAEPETAVATAPPKAPAGESLESGPRQAGARRSAEKARGSRRRKSSRRPKKGTE